MKNSGDFATQTFKMAPQHLTVTKNITKLPEYGTA